MFTSIFKVVTGRKKKKAVDTKGFVQLGSDGLFFQKLDEAYLNSPTATMALLKFHEYCVPIGLLDAHQSLWKKIENDYIRYGYFVLNVQYNLDAKVTGVIYKNPKDFLPKEQDDNDNISTFINTKSGKIYPAFNKNEAIVKAQFAKDGFETYAGQIYMYNDSSLPFRVTPLYSVLKWMQLENDASTYVSKASDNAMFGNNIFVVKASSSDLSDMDPEAVKEREILSDIKEALTEAKGVENTAQNILLEWKGDTEDVSKLISKVSISNDVNVDLLNAVDDKAESKICVACYNFPKILLFEGEGIFGDSGAAIQTAKDLWAESCLKEADNILDAFKAIGIKITKDIDVVVEVDTSIKDGQDLLRSTVGGFTAVLDTQKSVQAKTTTRESAIALFMTFMGLTRDEATALLGNPEIIETNGSNINTNPSAS